VTKAAGWKVEKGCRNSGNPFFIGALIDASIDASIGALIGALIDFLICL
jgi:hypothetical protein